MAFRCPDCGNNMTERSIESRIGVIDGWYCAKCDAFFDKKNLMKEIFKA